jgi:hypothetical protein
MYDFTSFTIVEAVKCGREVRTLGSLANSMEDAANEITRFFFDNFVERETGRRSCVLVRLFKTHDYAALDDELKSFARNLLDTPGSQALNCKCFTLLATCGAEAEWQSRKTSKGHQAIPLPSVQVVERIPMMRNMIKQMGLEINSVVHPDARIVMDLSQKTYNVFCVTDAEESPFVPAQQGFVKPYGVKSVLGFGGVLPSGNVFVVIIFSSTRIGKETANHFAPLALNVKMVILPHEEAVFAVR